MNDTLIQWCLSVDLYFVIHYIRVSKLFYKKSYLQKTCFVNKVLFEHSHTYQFACGCFHTATPETETIWVTELKILTGHLQKSLWALNCSIDKHLEKLTNKANQGHHELVDTYPNLTFLGELHLRLWYNEKNPLLTNENIAKVSSYRKR